MKNNKKVIGSTIAVLLIAVIALFGYKMWVNSKVTIGEKTITVTVRDDSTNYKKDYTHTTSVEMLGQAVDEMALIKADDSEFGRYVHTVDNIYADQAKEEWWKVLVNKEDAQTGIDSIPIQNGDQFEFVFTKGW